MERITVGFSIHRPELIPMTAALMRHHDAIVLEEPPAEGFRRMLQGRLSIDDYLLPLDVEYPEFSRRMCRLLREFHGEGKPLLQVEPFLEHLLAIHLLFADGYGPGDLVPDSDRHRVYEAERQATGALLDYYQVVMNGSFEATLAAVIRFARCDAARFRLRDALRAEAVAGRITGHRSVFVEAGSIHLSMWHRLRQAAPAPVSVKPVFIAHEALKSLGEKGHLFGPGDQLTLTFIFHPDLKETHRERLLAARALIYTKLIEKEEVTAEENPFPHVRNELACIRKVKQLDLADCKRLFPLIRGLGSVDARRLVDDYLEKMKPLWQRREETR